MSGPKLEKWSIWGSSKLTRNPISTSWYFCSTDWWTSEFRHFCIWNYQKLNKRSYYTFKNNYDSPKAIPHWNTDPCILETWPFGNIISVWKQIFIVHCIGKKHRILEKRRLETKSVYGKVYGLSAESSKWGAWYLRGIGGDIMIVVYLLPHAEFGSNGDHRDWF